MKKIKYYFIYLLGIAALFSACSSDDGPEPSARPGNQVGLFADDARPITVPKAMQESEDPHALTANLYLSLSVGFSSYAQYFEVPEGATKRNQPITAANARMAANDYTVWEWGTEDFGVAYQYSEQGNQQVFEIFIREGGKGYLKWYEVTQSKDGKKGTLKFFESLGIALQWNWEIKADESYHLNYITESFKYEIISNKDLSGSIKFFEDNILTQEMGWDKIGNGWWKQYDAGELKDSGEWTV